tara:strand:- start:505 stop:666 length:162 start_codon:yes stop_codon:yes gene_type:complete
MKGIFEFEGKNYIISNTFTDGGVVVSKNGKTIIRLHGVLGRENWIPLKLIKTK